MMENQKWKHVKYGKKPTKPHWKIKCFGCGSLLSKDEEYFDFASGAFCLSCGYEIEYDSAISEYVAATCDSCRVCDAPIAKGEKYCRYHKD